MFGTSWLVPVERMTLTHQRGYWEKALMQAVDRMLELKLVTSQDDLVVRLIRSFDDLGVGTILENEWAFALAAGANAGAITAVARPSNQIVVFAGIDDHDAAPVATTVTFRTAAAGGTTKMMVDLQVCRGWVLSAGMLSEPVVYDPQQNIVVDINSDAVHAREDIVFLGYVVEPRGGVVS